LELVGCKYVPVDLYEGDNVDAQYISLTANIAHGLRRTNADKRKSVEMALKHPWMSEMSNVAIAEELCVSEFVVRKVRDELEGAEMQHEESADSGSIKSNLQEDAPPQRNERVRTESCTRQHKKPLQRSKQPRC